MSESRTDLLNWINELLQLNLTKVEQLGTGAAYCQIIDSIYGDVQLSKVKFNANQEFQYVQNFKVLQTAFDKHHITNAIPVERLIKLRFQDNIEFTQWLKKFWDSHYSHGSYDAVARRNGSSVAPPVSAPPMTLKKSHADSGSSRRISSSSSTDASNPKKASSGGLAAGSTTPSTVPLTLSATSTESAKLRELNVVVAELKLTLENMERERDFYFAKLRELEVLIQTQAETMEKPDMIRQIQEILYSNETPTV